MTAALRVGRRAARQTNDPAKDYLDRLIKLIPAEVVGLYLAGKGAIQSAYPASATGMGVGWTWFGWTLFCLLALFLVRVWATSDRKAGVGPQWGAVFIAAGSFVIWIYSLGDGFVRWGLWNPLFASLLLLAWSFLVPFIYKGDDGAATAQPAPSAGRSSRPWKQPNFGPEDAEACVLNCAERLTNREFPLSATVSDGFNGEQAIRVYLGAIQDVMRNGYGITVDLAGGSVQYINKIAEMTFLDLAIHIEDKAAGK